MRAACLAFAIAVGPAVAAADSPPDSGAPAAIDAATAALTTEARTVQLAFTTKEDGYFRHAFAKKVVVIGLEFDDRKCQREFGPTRTTARGKARLRLATCLLRLTHAPETTAGPRIEQAASPAWATLESAAHEYRLRYLPDRDGTLTLATIELVLLGELNGVADGDWGGSEGGVVGGVVGGVGWPSPPPPPPPPAPPQNVAPTALERLRIAGDKKIEPDDDTKLEIKDSGKAKLVGAFKLCIAATGDVSVVTQLKSTGFPAYDRKLKRGILMWKYSPFVLNGQFVPVCTSVTFIYIQK